MLKFVGCGLAGCCLIVSFLPGSSAAKVWTNEMVVQRLKTVPIDLTHYGPRGMVEENKERDTWRINHFVERELMFVTATDASIEPPLEAMLGPANEFPRHCRAMFGLVRRGNRRGLDAAAKMIRYDHAIDRIAGWRALCEAPNLRMIHSLVSQEAMLSLYRDEKEASVLSFIETFFSRQRAKFAVAELSRRALVEKDLDRCSRIVEALGAIGDPAAIAAITTSRAKDLDKIRALERLADSAGAPFLAEHLESAEATIALARCKGPVAHAAIMARWDGSRPIVVPEGTRDAPKFLEDYREHLLIALTLVESKSPRRELLDMAKNIENSDRLRRLAIYELNHLGPGDLLPECLAFYRSQMQTTLGARCVQMFNDVAAEEVTAAMTEHLMILQSLDEAPVAKDSGMMGKTLHGAENIVFQQLHKRIGNRIFAL